VTLKGQTGDTNTLRAQYLENGWRYIETPFQDHQYEMAYGVSIDHVTDDVGPVTPKGTMKQYCRLS